MNANLILNRKTYSGVVMEREYYHASPYTKNIRDAEPKPPPDLTPEERQEYNNKQSLKRFVRIINNNFGPWSWWVTLTFYTKYYVDDFPRAKNILNNYIKRLQYANPDVKVAAVMGRGKKTNRIHYHLVISGVDRKTISAKWKEGRIRRIESLRKDNIYNGINHGQDYTGLATYMFEHWTPDQGRKRWRDTKNLEKPKKPPPKLAKRAYCEDNPPPTPKGYMLVAKKSTKYGYHYFKYVLAPKAQEEHMRC